MNGVNLHEMKTVHIVFHFFYSNSEELVSVKWMTDKNSRLAPPAGVTRCRKSESPQCCCQGNQIPLSNSYFKYNKMSPMTY